MMIAVQTLRATTRPSPESAMSAWTNYNATLKAMDSASAYLHYKKRKRDCFEAYDYQAHRHQKMRYSLLRQEPPRHFPSNVPPRDSLEQLADHVIAPKGQLFESPDAPRRSYHHHSRLDSIHKARRRKKSSSSSKRTSSHQRRAVRMTRKHYNKKKKLELMEATDRHIKGILATGCSMTSMPSPKWHYVRQKAEQLDLSLRDQCNSIVQKEQDIKSWLGMTTSNKAKIVSLRKRLHERWAEVKDLQAEVKPKRQRLKNLKFAALCEERTITEE